MFEGWRIAVVHAEFEAPDGEHFSRDVVRHPGAVAVVPVTDAGSALLVRQYRGAFDRHLLEIPAGTRDVEAEPPEETARRELEEEVGVHAGSLRLLATILNSPGFCDEETLIYVASDLRPGRPARHGPEERFIDVVEVPLSDVPACITRGDVVDAQTVVGLLLARGAVDVEAPSGELRRPGDGSPAQESAPGRT